MQPTQRTLDAFGLRDPASHLPGGQGEAYLSGEVVLKPAGLEAEARWVAETIDGIDENGFRVSRPVRSLVGDWIADGWVAWQRVEGLHDNHTRWPEVVDVCDAFHRALEGIGRPDFMDQRDTPWDFGDRLAWGEVDEPLPEPIAALVDGLRADLVPIDADAQVVHADVTSNVLFAERLAPAVIDYSLYFRPVGFAASVVIVDALMWWDADPSLLGKVAQRPDAYQLLLRATIFRLATSAKIWSDKPEQMAKEVAEARRALATIRSSLSP